MIENYFCIGLLCCDLPIGFAARSFVQSICPNLPDNKELPCVIRHCGAVT